MNIDELIRARQTTRSFTDEVLSKEILETIIDAGRQAPFAGLAQAGCSDFRHFFVLRRGTPICEKLSELVIAARRADYEESVAKNYAEKYPIYANVVKGNLGKAPTDLYMSPLLVIVAERAGMPAREHVALGYVMENMWLKATDLGVGMKLCSGVGDVKDTDGLKALLGLPLDEEFAFDGCNLGYATGEVLREGTRPMPQTSITYL